MQADFADKGQWTRQAKSPVCCLGGLAHSMQASDELCRLGSITAVETRGVLPRWPGELGAPEIGLVTDAGEI